MLALAGVADEASKPKLLSYRFALAANGEAVVDVHSRLMWTRCAHGQRWNGQTCEGRAERSDWRDGQQAPELCGFRDWRLPDREDLESLLLETGIPAIDTTVFPNTPPSSFWTRSESADHPHKAWFVNFGMGRAGAGFKESRFHVRWVREAQR